MVHKQCHISIFCQDQTLVWLECNFIHFFCPYENQMKMLKAKISGACMT